MTEFPQLLCGWSVVTLESSGTGVGVVAHSGNWPPALGFTTRELGPLISLTENGLPTRDPFVLEFSIIRGVAVAAMKTPSNARPGTCVAHLVAGERGLLDGATALRLYHSANFRTTLDDSFYPTDQWPPLSAPPEGPELNAAVDSCLDEPWLPVLLGAVLAHLGGQGPGLVLRAADFEDVVTMLRTLYGMLPRKTLWDLTFTTNRPLSPEAPAITAVIGDGQPALPSDRCVITPDSRNADLPEAFLDLGHAIVDNRKLGVALPDSLDSAHAISEWCYHRHLRSLQPAQLDDAQLATVITDPELDPAWFTGTAVADRAIRLAVQKPGIARALARIDHRPSTRAAFEQALIDRILTDTRGRDRTTQVARQLGFDLTEVLIADAWRRLDGGQLASGDAEIVWPRVQQTWETGDSVARGTVADYLKRHRALREFAVGSRDRALVYATLSAELDDRGVHTGSSRLLHNAMYTNLPIVAQLVVNICLGSHDRYALEQIMSCAPADRLPELIAECTRYPAVSGAELMRAVTITRSGPAELVEALRPAWRELRKALRLPEPIETLVVLDAAAADEDARRNGLRLPRKGFRKGRQGGWSREEVTHLLELAADDPLTIEENSEIFAAALRSDLEFVVARLAEAARTASGTAILHRMLLVAPEDRLPDLVTACAQQWDLDHRTLLRAVAALGLDPDGLVTALDNAWLWLRTRLDLPQTIAPLLALDAKAALPERLRPLTRIDDTRRSWQFWR